jgi:pimeloyl-ACP methyl ester carboxylesterase
MNMTYLKKSAPFVSLISACRIYSAQRRVDARVRSMRYTKPKSLFCALLFFLTLMPLWGEDTERVVIQENFDSTAVGSLPDSCKLEGTGSAQVVEADGKGKVLAITQPEPGETGPTLSLSCPPTTGDITVSLKLQPENENTIFTLMLQNRGNLQYAFIGGNHGTLTQNLLKPVPGSVYLGKYAAMDSKTVNPAKAWTELVLVVHLSDQTFDSYVNGIQTAVGTRYFTDARINETSKIALSVYRKNKGTVCFDDIVVQTGSHPPVGAKLLSDTVAPGEFPGDKSDFRGYDRYRFSVENGMVMVVCPKKPAPGNPWEWRGAFWGDQVNPGTELTVLADLKLVDRGFYIVIAGPGIPLGQPDGNRQLDAVYRAMTERFGLAKKPALMGLSRECLSVYRWASANPEKVACIYVDNGVCDLKSWPGGKKVPGNASQGDGQPDQWQLMLKTYHFKSDEEALAYHGNPIDILEPLAQARVPLLHVCGDSDTTVPYAENSAIVKSRYEQLGGNIQVILKPGAAHHPHGLQDPTPIVNFILKNCVP